MLVFEFHHESKIKKVVSLSIGGYSSYMVYGSNNCNFNYFADFKHHLESNKNLLLFGQLLISRVNPLSCS